MIVKWWMPIARRWRSPWRADGSSDMRGACRRAGRGAAVVAAVLTCLTACALTSGDDVADSGATARSAGEDVPPAVLFEFEDTMDASRPQTSNTGSLQGAAEGRVANGGRLDPQPGPDGQAVRFPAFDASPNPPRAVLVYWSDGAGMDPGEHDFRLGADFMLDAVTQGENDDGNNLVQRGLSSDRLQYKLQADNGFASCRLEGDQGSVTVTSGVRIEPQVWYSLTCSRAGDEVTLVLQSVTGEELDTVRRGARIGSLTFDRSVPLTMGGKLTPDGVVVQSESDQLNGALDNVFVHVG